METALLIAVISWALAWLGAGAMHGYARRRDLLDHPNHRSSHEAPTPRGGGLGIILALAAFGLWLGLQGRLAPELAWCLGLGGGALAAIGLWDDHGHVARRLRLVIHLGAAALALALLGPPELPWALPAWLVGGLTLLALAWLINLYNFMDGIDGYAGAELACVAGVAALLLAWQGTPEAALWALAACFAALGFLAWNWPPARLFMGDVGSGFVGYLLGVLALWTHQSGGLSLWVWLILLGGFVVDASITLLRRLLRREPVHQAHRSHAYQCLARRLGGHTVVTRGLVALNLLWLAPLAVLAVAWPQWTALWLALAWGPLLAAVWVLGGEHD